MSIVTNIYRKIFGTKKEKNELEIVFHKDANTYGSHGTIRASHKDYRLENACVRFAYVGTSVPPPLSPEVFAYLWEKARAAGFIPTELMTYGRVIEVSAVDSAKYLTSPERRRMETMHEVKAPA